MGTAIPLLIILLVTTVSLNAQTAAGYADERGPKLTNKVEAQFSPNDVAMGTGGTVWVYVNVDRSGKAVVSNAFGPVAPCSFSDDPRAAAIRQAAVAAAAAATFEPPPSAATTSIQFRVPFPPAPVEEKGIPKYVSGGILNGKATSLPKPVYPEAARAAGAKGPVSIMVTVDTDGSIAGAAGVGGDPRLFGTAVEAACKARLAPTLLSGHPVKISGVFTYDFVP